MPAPNAVAAVTMVPRDGEKVAPYPLDTLSVSSTLILKFRPPKSFTNTLIVYVELATSPVKFCRKLCSPLAVVSKAESIVTVPSGAVCVSVDTVRLFAPHTPTAVR